MGQRVVGGALFYALKELDAALRLVLMTGHPMQEELEELPARGLAGWLLKPPKLEK